MGNIEAVRMLLRASVKIDSRNEISKTPMHLAAENGHVPLVVIHRHTHTRTCTHTHTHSYPPYLPPSVVRELLRYQHDTIQDEDEDSNSPLHLACIHGHVGVVKTLIAAKCDVEARFVINP